MMGLRGRAFLLLICAVTCLVVYFTYILNPTSESRMNKYKGIDGAIVEAKETPDHYKVVYRHKESFHYSSTDSAEDLLVLAPAQENTSLQIGKVGSAFIHEQSTVRSEDDYVTSRNIILSQTVMAPKPKQKKQRMGYITKSIPTIQIPFTRFGFSQKDDRFLSGSLPDRNNSVQEKISKEQTLEESAGWLRYEGRSGKNGALSETFEAKSLGLVNETSHEIQEKLLTWKRKQEARFEEERKVLEEGNRKLLEEKIRFQQEMSKMMQEVRRGSIVDVRQKFVSRPLRPVDPDQWEGLNNTFVDSRYPGIVLLEGYKLGRPFVAPEDASAAGMQGQPRSVDEMLDSQAEERFFQLISEVHLDCVVIRRMGSLSDGGWDVCTVPPYVLDDGCIVYSFGINYDFTFDDAMANSFNCDVKAFDPSMSVGDHIRSAKVHFYQLGLGAQNTVTSSGWKLNTFRHILKKLGHEKSIIDILKIDIEFYEWECLRNMIADNSLDNVKQLMFEMHTPEVAMVQRPSTKEDFSSMYDLLSDLEKAGFRRYNVHMNPLGQYTSSRTGKTRSCCFELYYVNIRFLK